jgi:Uma2 family endonuclease
MRQDSSLVSKDLISEAFTFEDLIFEDLNVIHDHSLPTMDDLPSEDPKEPGLPDEFHGLQPQLLSRTLRLPQYSSREIYTASDMNLYYDLNHPSWHKRPDWFLAVGVPRLYDGQRDRSSYVIWQERVAPTIVVEFLSPGTEAEDLGRFAARSPKPKQAEPDAPPGKFQVYEQILKVPHYAVFDKRDSRLRYFVLQAEAYQEQAIAPTNPRLWIPELEIGLAIWQGLFEGLPQAWLRWCDADGTVLLTDTEIAEQERDQAQAQVRQIALNLLESGMSNAQVMQMTGLSQQDLERI